MKVYMFSEHYASRQSNHPADRKGAREERKKYIRGSNAMADTIEISPEALERFEREKVRDLNRERIRKSVQEYYPIIKEYVDLTDGDLRKLYRPRNVDEIRNTPYDFGRDEVLKQAAERIELLITH
ncbi:MAG TPA: hypothetical protein ENN21_11200 [Spirochaetes bacterium]|nr:hypothetical protein [Spirochaetota bacterium]